MSTGLEITDKRLIADSFSRAAGSYDAAAQLQREVGHGLLRRLPPTCAPRCWLDLGCGTGYFSRQLQERYAGSEGLAVDIAEGMLRRAREQTPPLIHLAGDAEALPLTDACCDLVFSNLALQWCTNFAQVLEEARRVLRPGGVLAFSSLVAGSLGELRDSWKRVDGYVHVNRFRTSVDYQRLCRKSGLSLLSIDEQSHVEHFADLRSLMRSLKDIGAHNVNPGRPSGLSGRARLQALQRAYECQREPEGLPLTYQVIYGVLRKPN